MLDFLLIMHVTTDCCFLNSLLGFIREINLQILHRKQDLIGSAHISRVVMDVSESQALIDLNFSPVIRTALIISQAVP